ncbi:hypothetical protein [Arthrobacter sp. NicSoilB8]|uniref:hypothetical protein n=1 Tax=Arthrobacter sp. NicSoilB8 TaxID=2830998 RepID=UPI001CC56635|nr:hypothetical protein [Arthrobacter sp. NicSoilB8]BCW70032.1 hypothetical protein NicSoilB8_10760 [Arthrobacter sp. NicSoilB8]
MLNVKTWWAVIHSTVVPRPGGGVSATARDSELQYCWLLPGDLTYAPTAAAPDPDAAGE